VKISAGFLHIAGNLLAQSVNRGEFDFIAQALQEADFDFGLGSEFDGMKVKQMSFNRK
jgi:hypothetical protein